MRKQQKAIALAAILVIAVGGCSQFGHDDWDEASPESQGYRWVGKGDPANFGGAYSFCRETLRTQNQSVRLLGGSGIVTTQPGGPTTVPGYYQTTPASRYEVADRRQFQGCMEAQGWELADTIPPAPAGQPVNPVKPTRPQQPTQ